MNELKSVFGYFSGYKPKSIPEQTIILRRLFPGIGVADEQIARRPLPQNAEGLFVIPKWELMALTYGEAVQTVLEMIKNSWNGKFLNHCRESALGPQYLRQSTKAIKISQELADEQRDRGSLIVAAQFGLRHRGRSVHRANESMNVSEFGLGAFAVGIMLLTHSERLQHDYDLWIDCAGDEVSYWSDGRFSSAPWFGFSLNGQVWFGARSNDGARTTCGAASASATLRRRSFSRSMNAGRPCLAAVSRSSNQRTISRSRWRAYRIIASFCSCKETPFSPCLTVETRVYANTLPMFERNII